MSEFLEGSGEEGFVYISFGSYASTANLPIETQQMFFDVLRSFPKVNFIWKWEGLRSKEMPGNVYTTEWAPQQAVLGTDY
jgi:glucuronosyltransferase